GAPDRDRRAPDREGQQIARGRSARPHPLAALHASQALRSRVTARRRRCGFLVTLSISTQSTCAEIDTPAPSPCVSTRFRCGTVLALTLAHESASSRASAGAVGDRRDVSRRFFQRSAPGAGGLHL